MAPAQVLQLLKICQLASLALMTWALPCNRCEAESHHTSLLISIAALVRHLEGCTNAYDMLQATLSFAQCRPGSEGSRILTITLGQWGVLTAR